MKQFWHMLALAVLCIVLVCPFVGAAEPQSQKSDVAAANAEDEKAVVEMIEQALAKINEKGVAYTIRLLNASAGPFRKKELYVFAADMKGLNLSHPTRRELIGKDSWNLKDAKGMFLVQEMIKVVKENGSGWVEYWWLRPNEKEPAKKRAFVKRVPGQDLWLGCAYIVR